jgi:hypothetical protein
MLAELAAANAAFSVIKKAVSNGRELGQYAHKIGEIVGAKEALQKKVNKKKATDFEEFMALERVKEQEDELKQIMIYCGRPGLWHDWVRFQTEARKARREAEEAAKKRVQWWIEVTVVTVCFLLGIVALGVFIWWLYQKHNS